jgi:nucleotide-binding universal stress UspA family protein
MVAVREPWETRGLADYVGATDLDVGPSTDDGAHRRAHDRVMGIRPLFQSVLCGVDGTPASRAAVGAAAAIVAGHGELHFLAVLHASGAGHPRGACLTKRTADGALDAAVDRAAELGVRSTTTVVRGWHRPATHLLEAARNHDLLVVGGHGGGRIEGFTAGWTTATLAHRATRPLLLACRPTEPEVWFRRIVVGIDGHDGQPAVNAASWLAAKGHGEVELVHAVGGIGHPQPFAGHMAAVADAIGHGATFEARSGPPAEVILSAVRRDDASLVVIGRSRPRGLRAWGSVSERVVQRAPCSVLVVP